MTSKILVVEDDASIRSSLVDLLDAEDYDVRGADDGAEGVQQARDFLPDLIICDIMMPEIDGYGVLDQLRLDPATATIPFIFLTAKADRADLRRGMGLGADDYLTKPFTRDEILTAIEARLTRRAAVVEQYQKKLDDLRNSITLALPHELRTPLSGIKTGASVIAESADMLRPEDVKHLADIVYQSAERLEHLIVNYLTYAELEVAQADPVRLEALRDRTPSSVLLIVAQMAREKTRRVHREADLKMDVQDAAVRIAEPHLAKIVEELVDNACKFSLPGAPIMIAGRRDAGTFRMTITDQGRGMTPEQIANVGAYLQFERKLHEQQGSGLGLIIARRLIELYDGELTIESIYGARTTVGVSLPL
jgi:CheY-like chemotaxis protein/two-component sensor histidine kinase